MSRIYIPGMEMPTEGGTIVVYKISGKYFAARAGKEELFPLRPVPDHGRLIDAETLINAIIAKYIRHERHRELVFAVVQIKQDMVDIINELPTIIPADKEGEG